MVLHFDALATSDQSDPSAWLSPRPFIIQGADLSTLGYRELCDPAHVPPDLAADARASRSDLYIVCPSIPFEPDPLRYERESTDQYWINLLERFELPYAVLDRRAAGQRSRYSTNWGWSTSRTSTVSNPASSA